MNAKILLLSLTAGALCLPACTTQQTPQTAKAKDPEKAQKKTTERRADPYQYNPEPVDADLKKVRTEYDRLMGNVRKESAAKWGRREAEVLPTRTRYVKYTDNYRNRVTVDFEAGTILVEHLDEEGVKDKLRNAAVVALLTPDEPGAVDLFSDKEVTLSGKPFLQDLVVDEKGVVIQTREEIERYIGYLVGERMQARRIDADGVGKKVFYVQMNMVNAHVDKRALQYVETVRKHAETAQVSRSLIHAIIKTESAFNPFAISDTPAFGMMQLLPSGSGREAYRKAKGQDAIPDKEYLFDAGNSIELGAAYLGVLLNDSPLREIRDPLSREYCAIAAYNTGPANVFRAFSKQSGKARQDEALDRINAMQPDEVYDTLRTKLPYAETRGYVLKVVDAKKRYAAM